MLCRLFVMLLTSAPCCFEKRKKSGCDVSKSVVGIPINKLINDSCALSRPAVDAIGCRDTDPDPVRLTRRGACLAHVDRTLSVTVVLCSQDRCETYGFFTTITEHASAPPPSDCGEKEEGGEGRADGGSFAIFALLRMVSLCSLSVVRCEPFSQEGTSQPFLWTRDGGSIPTHEAAELASHSCELTDIQRLGHVSMVWYRTFALSPREVFKTPYH